MKIRRLSENLLNAQKTLKIPNVKEEKNAKKTGAAIANGALQQDISNEAAKLAMDLAHQEKMMKFEQDQRKGMLFLEQSQRLQNLAISKKDLHHFINPITRLLESVIV